MDYTPFNSTRPRPARFKGEAMVDTPPGWSGLIHFDLPLIFRCSVELAEAAALLPHSEWADVPVDIEDPQSPYFERWMELDIRLDRVKQESERVKRSLGAFGSLEYVAPAASDRPTWPSYQQRFANTVHDRTVRLALLKLATAAIDLSGFAKWLELQWSMRDKGVRLLSQGLAQLWAGMSVQERSAVQDRLPRTQKSINWPNSINDPEDYSGPEEIELQDQFRIISNFTSCYKPSLKDMQLESRFRDQQGQARFVRQANVSQFVRLAETASKAFEAIRKGDSESPDAYGDLYQKVFWILGCMRQAMEVPPAEKWHDDALEQRHLLADAADRLLGPIGKCPEDKDILTSKDAKKALKDYMLAAKKLRRFAKLRTNSCDLQPPKNPIENAPGGSIIKRGTKRNGTEPKIIAALTKHHRFSEDSCLNLEPIKVRELAKQAEVSAPSASRFFDKKFDGYDKYKVICLNPGRLVDQIKALRGEFNPDEQVRRFQEELHKIDKD